MAEEFDKFVEGAEKLVGGLKDAVANTWKNFTDKFKRSDKGVVILSESDADEIFKATMEALEAVAAWIKVFVRLRPVIPAVKTADIDIVYEEIPEIAEAIGEAAAETLDVVEAIENIEEGQPEDG